MTRSVEKDNVLSLVVEFDTARFEAKNDDLRFTFEFEVLKPSPNDSRPRQTGACKLPGGETLNIIVNDEQGAATADNLFRVFAGLRSDPFFIGWLPLTPVQNLPNYAQHRLLRPSELGLRQCCNTNSPIG